MRGVHEAPARSRGNVQRPGAAAPRPLAAVIDLMLGVLLASFSRRRRTRTYVLALAGWLVARYLRYRGAVEPSGWQGTA